MSARELLREIAGVVLLGIGALLLLALASFDIADIPERVFPPNATPRNWAGAFGARLAFELITWVGTIGAVGAALSVVALGGGLLSHARASDEGAEPARADLWRRLVGAFALVLVLAVVERMTTGRLLPVLPGRAPGGYWGEFLVFELSRRLEGPGAAISVAALALVGLVLATDRPLARLLSISAERARDAAEKIEATADEAPPAVAPRSTASPEVAEAADDELADLGPEGSDLPLEDPVLGTEPETVAAPRAMFSAVAARVEARTEQVEAPKVEAPKVEAPRVEAPKVEAPRVEAPKVEAPRVEEPVVGEEEPAPAKTADETAPRLPPIDLLTAPTAPAPSDRGSLDDKARRIEDVLAQFKVDAKVVQIERGPNVTLFALELGRSVKVARVASVLDNLALALRVPGGIRMQAPIPNTSWVGLEVPNDDQDTVAIRELIENPSWRRKDPALPLFLGKDTAGRPLIADLAKMPHLLIAGSTGSGKSVCLNTILVSLLATRTSREVKLILIDPKQVELAQFARVPHLLTPVVTDMHKAGAVLDWAVRKMEERYGWLARVGVRHVREYDALGKDEIARRLGVTTEKLEQLKMPWRLGYVVVVVDELNDLMMVAQKEVEASIVRLAQKSRAVGIHVVLATQRPSVDVITGVIKSNLPARIAFQVTSKVDSRTILDMGGAEKLLGQGDMLFLPPGRGAPIRAKGAFVSDDEIQTVVAHLAHESEPEFSDELAKCAPARRGKGPAARAQDVDGDEADAKRDEVYDAACRVVLTEGKGSVSLLQRKLEIGYGRAARFMDMMEEDGLVGPAKGSKPREVRTNLERWEAARQGRDQSAAA